MSYNTAANNLHIAMVDALRVGRARERALALQELKRRFSSGKPHNNEKSC
jgi:hypothetical protein